MDVPIATPASGALLYHPLCVPAAFSPFPSQNPAGPWFQLLVWQRGLWHQSGSRRELWPKPLSRGLQKPGASCMEASLPGVMLGAVCQAPGSSLQYSEGKLLAWCLFLFFLRPGECRPLGQHMALWSHAALLPAGRK